MTRINRAMGIALASLLAVCAFMSGSAAFADDSSAAPPAAQTDRIPTHVLVAHDLNGYRPCRQGDNGCAWALTSDYQAYATAHPDAGMLSVEDVLKENANVCSATGDWIRRSLSIKVRIAKIRGRPDKIEIELVNLGTAENRVTMGRRGTEVVSSALLCLIPGVNILYCGAAIAGNVGNELQGSVHDKADAINREQSMLTNDITGIDLDTRDLDIDERIGWASMVHGYCLKYFPDETTGTAPPTR